MNFLMNELSIHGQFHTAGDFFKAVETLMEIRREIRRLGSEFYCHRDLAHAQVTAEACMAQVIQSMPLPKRRAWLEWLTRYGPYWTDDRQHSPDDWLELDGGEIVTDKAIGEVAFCVLHNLHRELISVNPSTWLINPVTVTWKKADEAPETVDVRNHWSLDTVSQTLAALPPSFDSWRSLERLARNAFNNLTVSSNAFDALDGHTYVPGAAERIWIRLDTLNKLCGCFDDEGERTAEGDRIYANHFTGEKAWFTDSSAGEKNDFESDLTFQHPEKPDEYLFCPWHGKVKTPQLRIHFSWPIAAHRPAYVVYIGPKITKRG